MKKSVVSIAAACLVAVTLIASCESGVNKEEVAQENVNQAKQDLKEVKQEMKIEAQKTATAEEWATFKKESEVKIYDNEVRISELKAKKAKKGKTFDGLYAERINILQEKNAEMKSRIYNYEKEQSDWESFKREFNHDMDELGNAINDITVDNKN